MCKFKLNPKERAIVNCKSGEIMRPSCFDDLSALYSYMQKSDKSGADDLLKRVFKGEKVITNMIADAQRQFVESDHKDEKKKKKDKK